MASDYKDFIRCGSSVKQAPTLDTFWNLPEEPSHNRTSLLWTSPTRQVLSNYQEDEEEDASRIEEAFSLPPDVDDLFGPPQETEVEDLSTVLESKLQEYKIKRKDDLERKVTPMGKLFIFAQLQKIMADHSLSEDDLHELVEQAAKDQLPGMRNASFPLKRVVTENLGMQ